MIIWIVRDDAIAQIVLIFILFALHDVINGNTSENYEDKKDEDKYAGDGATAWWSCSFSDDKAKLFGRMTETCH